MIEAGDGENFNFDQFLKIKPFYLGLIELRRIEAAEDIAYQLSQSPNVVYLNQNSNMLLNFL